MAKNRFSLTNVFWNLIFKLYDIAEAIDGKKNNGNKK